MKGIVLSILNNTQQSSVSSEHISMVFYAPRSCVFVYRYMCDTPILAAVDAKKCYATGRGIQPKGVRIGEDADFCVHTKGAGEGELVIKVVGPGGVEERLRIRKVCLYSFFNFCKNLVTK